MFSRLKAFLFSMQDPYADDIQDFFSRLPEITTQRLLLRMARRRDASDIFTYAQDPLVAEHVLWDAHVHFSDSLAYVRYLREQYRLGKPSSWVIVLQATGKVIGTIGYTEWDEENEILEIGYSLSREYWNQGYMTEALQAVIRLSFDQLPVHRLEAMHEVSNPASGRVMAKCGMKEEGTMIGRVWNKNHFSDVVMYGITREAYTRS